MNSRSFDGVRLGVRLGATAAITVYTGCVMAPRGIGVALAAANLTLVVSLLSLRTWNRWQLASARKRLADSRARSHAARMRSASRSHAARLR